MLFVLFLLCVSSLAAQAPTPEVVNPLAGQPAAIEAGQELFANACSACHGAAGEGGRGPNLSDGKLIRRAKDDQLFQSIQKGVPGSDMPPFSLPDEKIWQLAAYVRNLGAPAYETKVAGDPEAGSQIFWQKAGCAQCHMIRGRGGFLGPDLSNIGAQRSWRLLREAVLQPSARLAEGYRGVTVTTLAGEKISGVAKNNTNYSIQILDASGRLHLLLKQDLREVAFRKQSLMPEDYPQRLQSADIENLLAFLSRQALRDKK
jgi:cytochrome c oxidase cbb3-type subunit 3